MPAFILSTCGTSLLTYKTNNDLRSLIGRYSNYSDWNDIPHNDRVNLRQHIDDRVKEFLQETDENVKKMSAELNGLLTWHNQSKHKKSNQDIYYLLATDTLFGSITTDTIKTWLTAQGYQCWVISQSGLKTSSLSEFRSALSPLVKELVLLVDGYKNSQYDIYFNLTGGFKGLNGFLQAVATIYADKTFYLFEGSSELLFIPKLPYGLNDKSIILDNLLAFRRLAEDLPVNDELIKSIPDILLFDIDGQFVLSEWGELIWQSTISDIYKQKIWGSISDNIIFDDEFINSTKKLSPELMIKVNKTIGALAKYTENGCQHRINSLDPKPLQQQEYKQQNLWECDVDQGHYRIYMTKDGHKFYLKEVGEALHKPNAKV